MEYLADASSTRDSFGSFIKRARKANGLTQNELAKKIGVSTKTLQRYEKGETFPDTQTIAKIADETRVRRNYMINMCIASLPDTEPLKNELISTLPSDYYYNICTNSMERLLNRLNLEGQAKAVEQVEILTKVPEYQRTPDQEEE